MRCLAAFLVVILLPNSDLFTLNGKGKDVYVLDAADLEFITKVLGPNTKEVSPSNTNADEYVLDAADLDFITKVLGPNTNEVLPSKTNAEEYALDAADLDFIKKILGPISTEVLPSRTNAEESVLDAADIDFIKKATEPNNNEVSQPNTDDKTSPEEFVLEAADLDFIRTSLPKSDDETNSEEFVLDADDIEFIKKATEPNNDDVSIPKTDDKTTSDQKKCVTADNEFGICVPKSKCGQDSINTVDFEMNICPVDSTCCPTSGIQRESDRNNSINTFNNGFAANGEFPWVAAIMEKKLGESGLYALKWSNVSGTIVHPYVVITLASKVRNLEAEKVQCLAGLWGETQDRQVNKIIIHERFVKDHAINDIAMLVLEKPFKIGDYVGLARINPPPPALGPCFSIGWGQLFSGREYSYLLKKVEVKYIGFDKCQHSLKKINIRGGFELHPSHLCATSVGDDDLHIGDGGLPLVCRIEGSTGYTMHGIVAFGFAGDRPSPIRTPSVYVNIPYLYSWIDGKIKNEGINVNILI